MAGSVWVGGLATLLEKKSRRMELALYVLSRWVVVTPLRRAFECHVEQLRGVWGLS
jgi:hypothetical protein